MRSPTLSTRGAANVAAVMPKILTQVTERSTEGSYTIDMSTTENYLLRDELAAMCKTAISEKLISQHFSYPRGFAGDPSLLESLARLFNNYFNPYVPVDASHLATAPGAASCLDALLYNICDPDDGVLVPGPYWNGFDFQFRVRSSVQPVVVNVGSFCETFTTSLLPALDEAMANAPCRIKALVLTNPHNPFGQCLPQELLEGCLRFCQKHSIHLLSDEVYALTSFPCAELSEPAPFVSVLSLDARGLGCDLSRIHTIWSISKDFGASGFRMGCTVTQDNKELVVGLGLASNCQISSLSAIFTTSLLSSPTLPFLISLNSARLAESYILITSFFVRYGIKYIPVNAGLNIFARLAPAARTWDDESRTVQKLKEAGVLVSAGRNYHGVQNEKGWVRLSFSIEQNLLREALRRIEMALDLE